MHTDVWALLDTVTKLAVGAGFAWLWVTMRARARGGATSSRRLEILEGVAAEVGAVNHTFAKYQALVFESIRFGARWPSARREELELINHQLVRQFDALAGAEAKLLLLGEKTLAKTLQLYCANIAVYRKQVYAGRQDISEREIAEIKQPIMQLREQFYDLLSKRFDRVLAA